MLAANRQKVDLSKYAKKIANEDRPLFDEAVDVGKAGALRAAYVMIWLACAESLKRRFREARKRDSSADRIVGDIEKKEREHKSVDKFLLEKAREYGFLSDSGHTILNHVYEMRCLYGHPYEKAPSQEQVSHAAAVVVEHVLSKPVKLRHGFGEQLLKSLLGDRIYLDDQQTAVTAFTKDILPKLDESIHGWLLDNYWKELEELVEDRSMAIFFQRGIWFSRAMLMEVGGSVFSHDEWHDKIIRFPKTLMYVCSIPDLFRNIGRRAQDSLVGSILAESDTHCGVLTHLEYLDNNGALSKRQRERFTKAVERLSPSNLRSASLATRTCFQKLMDALKSYNYYTQNPAIELIVSNGPSQAADLNKEQQVELGRNILQAAEGGARSAAEFLEKLSQDRPSWPFDIVRGITLETFTNEKNEIRFKDRYLDRVFSALSHLNENQRDQIVGEIAASIGVGTPKSWVRRENFDSVVESLRAYGWTALLISSLKTKAASLPGEDEAAVYKPRRTDEG